MCDGFDCWRLLGLGKELLYVDWHPTKSSVLGFGERLMANPILTAVRLYGWTENNREVEMDMREMVDKVKTGEPLYGHSSLTPYMQGVAARNSRYSALMAQVIPWANFVNHNQVSGTDALLARREIQWLTHWNSMASIRRSTTNKRSES